MRHPALRYSVPIFPNSLEKPGTAGTVRQRIEIRLRSFRRHQVDQSSGFCRAAPGLGPTLPHGPACARASSGGRIFKGDQVATLLGPATAILDRCPAQLAHGGRDAVAIVLT